MHRLERAEDPRQRKAAPNFLRDLQAAAGATALADGLPLDRKRL